MLLMGVDTLVLKKPEEVELRIVLLPVLDEILPLLILEKIARSKAVIDALQLLNNDAPRAHVEVADFGRALIAIGKTNCLAAAIEKAMRIARTNLVDDRSLRSVNAIAIFALINAPTVTNDEYYRSHFYLSP
jgi:hypothetical protein